MIYISWKQFAQNQEAKDISFESFCFQVAYILYKDYGFFEDFYNTPGSEFYLTLHKDCPPLNLKSGDEIGWQVKWWFDREDFTSLNAKNKSNLIDNFSTTLKSHPNIKLWIICTPGPFVEREFNNLKRELTKLSSNTKFISWKKTTFINFRAANYEKFEAIYNHYFNINFISYNTIADYSKRKIDDLNKKFDADLYTPTKYDDEILFLLDYHKIFNELEIRIKYLSDDVKKIEGDKLYKKNDYSSFNKEYINTAYTLLYKCINEAKSIIEIISSKLNIEKAKILLVQLERFIDDYRATAETLNKKLNNKEYLISEVNQEEMHYHNNYLISSVNRIREQILYSEDNSKDDNSIIDLLDLVFQKNVNILSSAGYGKTNIACNICNTCLNNNIPSLLILGSSFRKIELPQNMILEQLGINSKYSFKEFLQALNNLGMGKGFKIPIIIDGLNESVPYESIWKGNIKDIIRDIYEYEYIAIIITCRDRYIESIFEETEVKKIPNIKILSGLDIGIREKAIRKYFIKYNIVPISWNFNKDLFINPLLLKIFSEVNTNKKNIRISLDNLFDSIDEYIDNIENKVSKTKSRVDPVLKREIHRKVTEYCKILWTKNVREIPLEEFHKIIDPQKNSLNDSITEKLLDEGLCFQKNLNINIETVQFTFDLIGGYSIAKNFLLQSITPLKNIVEELKRFDIENKIFNNKMEHPLRQDILMSLIHLFPTKLGNNIFEIFDNNVVFEECINSIDYFIGHYDAQEKLIKRIILEKTYARNFILVFEKVFENIFKKKIYGLEELLIKILMNLTQAEIDIFWSEQIRKNRLEVYSELNSINESYRSGKIHDIIPKQEIYHSFLATTSSDKSVRNLATENLYLLAKSYPDEIINLLRVTIGFKDINSIESVIVAICGSVLSLKNKTHTIKSLEFLTLNFIPNLKSIHICIIDYIYTIAEFAKFNFNVDYLAKISFDSSDFDISFDQNLIAKYAENNSFLFPHLLGLDLYDFNKYQLNAIATDEYEKRKTFTRVECLSILSNNIKMRGYKEEDFEEIHKDFQNDNKYKYQRGTKEKLTYYSEKYLWQSYYELVGYLVLTKKLRSENKNRYRCEDLFFDPTFPKLPEQFQIVNNCFFPSDKDDVQLWINSNKNDYLKDFFIHDLNTNKKWVLLSLHLVQDGESNNTRIEFYINSFLEKISSPQKKYKKGNIYSPESEFSHIFSGEINWSPFFNFNFKELFNKNSGLLNTTYRYTWTAWSFNRYENPFFKFFNPALSMLTNLKFQPNGLYYYNEKNAHVTKIIRSWGSELYYIRKDVIDEILKKTKSDLKWHQFLAKYGEWGKEKDRILNPAYKDNIKIIYYSKLKNRN